MAAPYDPWRDTDGASVSVGCRVEQIAVATEHGAIPRRLGKQGQVVRRTRYRVHVRFDGEAGKPATIRPFLIRVIKPAKGEEDRR